MGKEEGRQGEGRAHGHTWWNKALGLPPLQGKFADDPLGVALCDARRTMLDLEGDAVSKLWPGIRGEELDAVARRPHRVAVVVPP